MKSIANQQTYLQPYLSKGHSQHSSQKHILQLEQLIESNIKDEEYIAKL